MSGVEASIRASANPSREFVICLEERWLFDISVSGPAPRVNLRLHT